MNELIEWIVLIAIAFVNAFFGKKKGYNQYAWFFGGSLIGLIVLAFLQNITDIADDKKETLINRGNTIAICLAVASFVWGFAQGIK